MTFEAIVRDWHQGKAIRQHLQDGHTFRCLFQPNSILLHRNILISDGISMTAHCVFQRCFMKKFAALRVDH